MHGSPKILPLYRKIASWSMIDAMKQRTTDFDIIVIGGGPSGMMAAGKAGSLGKRVLLLEKNARLGEKLLITGGGRSNITNDKPSTRAFLEQFGDRAPFLHSAFAQHSVADTLSFFHSLGMETILEAEGRVFPKTEQAKTVQETLIAFMKKNNVTVRTDAIVRAFTTKDGRITGVETGNGDSFTARAFILSTGGLSHPETGSTGDGFRFLKALGHQIETGSAALSPVRTKETWSHALSGIAFPGAKVTILLDGTKAETRKGKILFTHFGLSGPLILNMSREISKRLHEGKTVIAIDLFPTQDLWAFDKTLCTVFDNGRNRLLKNALGILVPAALANVIPELFPEIGDKPVHAVTKAERAKIVRFLKGIQLTPTGLLGPKQSIVTAGGIPLEEVDMRTMASKKIPNLFVTGDLLDINRPSGGYSLQLCWTTGWVAGTHAAMVSTA